MSMKVGIVGTGFMGTTHAEAWRQTDAELHSCTSNHQKTTQAFAEKYGIQGVPDLQSMLSDVDVVDICVPTYLHHEMVLQAARAGKDIICEKPLSLTVEEGKEMIRVCEGEGARLLVAHVVRYFPEYAAARDQVLAGEVGKPALIRLSRNAFQPSNEGDNWYTDESKSGGMIMDLMIHDFDYARWVAGDVVRVFAKNITHSTGFDVPFDHAMAILTHESGAMSHIEGSWAMPKPIFNTSLEIAGADGLINYDSKRERAVDYAIRKSAEDEQSVGLPSRPAAESPFTTQIKDFYRALAEDVPARITARDSLAAVRIARAAIESSQTGKAVDISNREEELA